MCPGTRQAQNAVNYSPVGYFKTIDEAEIYAVEMAKTWIDAEFVADLTP